MYLYNTHFKDGRPALIREKELYWPYRIVQNAEHIYRLCHDIIGMHLFTEEYVYAIGVDSQRQLLGIFELSHGTVDYSFISPRELFLKLLLLGSVSFYLAHNHPSGSLIPSNEDIAVTTRLVHAGKIMNLSLDEHIIIGQDSYTELLAGNYLSIFTGNT